MFPIIISSGRVEIPEDKKFVIHSINQPTVETRSSHLNEVNSDFADRSQFHQEKPMKSEFVE